MTGEGLPPPPRPVFKPPTAPVGANDLDTSLVRDAYNQIATESNSAVAAWADKLQQARQADKPLKVPRFDTTGPGLLKTPDSELDQAMAVDPSKTDTGDMLKSVGSGMAYMFAHPWTAHADAQMINRVKAAQEDFLGNYSGTLTFMSEEMADVTKTLAALSAAMRSALTNLHRGRIDQIMNEKAACGNGAMNDLLDALDSTKDPQQRAELEKLKDELATWMNQRDSRLAKEKPTVDALAQRIEALADELAKEQQVIDDAKMSRGPSNTTSGNRIVDSTHIRPEAVDYARSLRNLLAGSRSAIDRALSGNR